MKNENINESQNNVNEGDCEDGKDRDKSVYFGKIRSH